VFESGAKCEPNVEGYPVKIPPSTNNLPAGFTTMTLIQLAYEHPGATLLFSVIALAFLGMFFQGVIGVIAALRGNYNAGPIDNTSKHT
jgi:hypothetical protein